MKDNNEISPMINNVGPDTPKPEKDKRGGMYRGVSVSVKILNVVAALAIIALVVVFVYALATAGFIVTFDSNGGTDVESVKLEYGVYEGTFDEPTREGYVFDGWYLDENFDNEYISDYIFTDSVTLYAKWSAK